MEIEDETRYKAPIVPMLKVTATIMLILTNALAYLAGNLMFVHLGYHIIGFAIILPVLWPVFGLLIGFLIYLATLMQTKVKIYLGFFLLVFFTFIVFGTPFLGFYYGMDYWDGVRATFIMNFVALGNFSIYLMAMLPATLGFLTIWKEWERLHVLPIFVMLIPVIYSGAFRALGAGVEIFSVLFVFYLILTFIIVDIRMMAVEMGMVDDMIYKTITNNIKRFLSFLPLFSIIFILMVVIVFSSTDIFAVLSPPVAAESIELRHTLYITGGVLLNFVLIMWLVGFTMRNGWPWLKKKLKERMLES